MQLDFSRNYFELFGLPIDFELDAETLSLRYRDLQRAAHPDRFAGASDQERRLAVQYASRINEAFRTLKDPLARARYLLEMEGVAVDDADTSMDPAFLMDQIELREALEGIKNHDDPFGELDRVRGDIEGRERDLVRELRNLFREGSERTLADAGQVVRKLQFMNRLLDQAATIEEDLVHES